LGCSSQNEFHGRQLRSERVISTKPCRIKSYVNNIPAEGVEMPGFPVVWVIPGHRGKAIAGPFQIESSGRYFCQSGYLLTEKMNIFVFFLFLTY
jgi:hypothetical protein